MIIPFSVNKLHKQLKPLDGSLMLYATINIQNNLLRNEVIKTASLSCTHVVTYFCYYASTTKLVQYLIIG